MEKLPSRRVIGLMSGTSVDGIDAALVEVSGSGPTLTAVLQDFICPPLEAGLRARVIRAINGHSQVAEIARLNVALGEAFAAAALQLMERHGPVDLIGSHGQTICHLPQEGVTLQVGEPAIIAERTGTPVVADFRQRDLACGGQGAPLVPYVDWALLRSATENRIVQNIGGIGNCTTLPKGAGLHEVRAWDTGPGNMLLDALARHFLGAERDEDGRCAAQGQVHAGLLQEQLAHPFLTRIPPKTTGHEDFGAGFAAHFLERCQSLNLAAPHALATATAFSAHSMARSYRDFVPYFPDCAVIVAGGGAANRTLMTLLTKAIAPARLVRHQDLGVEPHSKEALAFALLAHETVNQVPTGLPSVTGARAARVLGVLVPGSAEGRAP